MINLQTVYEDTKYAFHLKLLAGNKGLSNIMNWVYLLEDINNFSFLKESELIITTGLGYSGEQWLIQFIKSLIGHHSCGLIINKGKYIHSIPNSVIDLCNKESFPLFTMPWDVHIAELTRDYCTRIFHNETIKQSLKDAFTYILNKPEDTYTYEHTLKAHNFQLDSNYCCILINVAKQLQNNYAFLQHIEILCRNNINHLTYNYTLFYYKKRMMLILQDSPKNDIVELMKSLHIKLINQSTNCQPYIGIGSIVKGVRNLTKSYQQACAALMVSMKGEHPIRLFDNIGIYKILLSIKDMNILEEYYKDILSPIIVYDQAHKSDYLTTLRLYIKYNASVQKVADETFSHRNTINYRIRKIKELLHSDLSTLEERFPYQMAFYILDIWDDNLVIQ